MRRDDGWRGMSGRLSIVGWLILTCIGVFVYQLLISEGDIETPGGVELKHLLGAEVWRLVTYAVVHGDPLHLIINMLWLWMVGRLVLEDLGNRHFLGVFVAGAITGALVNVPIYPDHRLVGASAGVWALMVAVTVRFPSLPVGFPFLPGVTLRLRNLTIAFLLVEIISAVAQFVTRNHETAFVFPMERIASLAHLGGALAGWIYVKVLTGSFTAMVRQSEEREQWWREERARRREPTRVVAGRRTRLPEPRDPAPVDFIEELVDPILEKLHAHGPNSLSPDEHRILAEAARRLGGKGH